MRLSTLGVPKETRRGLEDRHSGPVACQYNSSSNRPVAQNVLGSTLFLSVFPLYVCALHAACVISRHKREVGQSGHPAYTGGDTLHDNKQCWAARRVVLPCLALSGVFARYYSTVPYRCKLVDRAAPQYNRRNSSAVLVVDAAPSIIG